jgi:enoyl-[acyl-carrier protein] reductase II
MTTSLSGSGRRRITGSIDQSVTGPELVAAVGAGGGHDLLPFRGQSAARVHDIVPAASLVGRLVTETEAALARVAGWTDVTRG